MADNFTPVGVTATVEDLGKFNSDIDKMNKKLGSVETTANDVGGGFAALGSKATAMGATVAAGVAAGVAAVGALGLAVGAVSFDFAMQADAALKDIQTQLGLTEEDALRFGKISKQVFVGGFAENIGEATEALVLARKTLGDLSDKDLQGATENAFKLSDAFGVDVGESLSAVRTLMDEFEISQEAAFGFLTSGYQNGLNASDDFIDSVGEYSNLFAVGGGDVHDFFAIMQSGLAGGALGTDKAADAFKEFQIRFIEGDKSLINSLRTLGLSYDDLVEQVESGDMTMVQAFTTVTETIGEVDTSLISNQAAVAALGSQFEDLGIDAVGAISTATDELIDFSSATDTLDAQYQTLPERFEQLKRRVLIALEPIGAKLLELAESVFPLVERAVQKMIEAIDWLNTNVMPALISGFASISTWFSNNEATITDSTDSIFGGLQNIMDLIQSEVMPPLLKAFENVKSWFVDNEATITRITESVFGGLKAIMNTLIDDVIPSLVRGIGSILQWFNDHQAEFKIVVDAWFTVIEGLGIVFAGVANTFSTVWNEVLKPTLKLIGDAIDTAVTVWGNLFTGDFAGALDELQKFWIGVFGADGHLATILSGFVNVAFELTTAILDGILSAFDTSTEELVSVWQNNWNSLQTILDEAGIALAKKVLEIINALVNEFVSAKNDFMNAARQALQGAVDGISQMAGNLISSLSGAINQAIEAFGSSDTIQKFMQIGKEIVNGIIQGVSDNAQAFIDVMIDLASQAWEEVKKYFGISSPSKLFAEVGRNIVRGLSVGVADEAPDFLNMLGTALLPAIEKTVITLEQAGRDLADAIIDPLVSSLESARVGTVFDRANDLMVMASKFSDKLGKASLGGKDFSSLFGSARDMFAFIRERGFNVSDIVGDIDQTDTHAVFAKLNDFFLGISEQAKDILTDQLQGDIIFGDFLFALKQGKVETKDVVSELSKIPDFLSGRTFDPMLQRLSELDDVLALQEERLLATGELSDSSFRQDVLLRSTEERNELIQQIMAAEQEITGILRQQQSIGQEQRFLEQQAGILQTIIDRGLDAESILGDALIGDNLEAQDLLNIQLSLQQAILSQDRERLDLLHQQALIQGDLTDEQLQQLRIEERQAALDRERQKLNFLQQQQQLLADIEAQEFDADSILQGFQFGAEAEMGAFLDAMLRFTQQLVTQTEGELGIASPSTVFAGIGENIMAGLQSGLSSAAQAPANLMSNITSLMTQRASAPPVMATQNNTFNTTINGGMDAAVFEARLSNALGI